MLVSVFDGLDERTGSDQSLPRSAGGEMLGQGAPWPVVIGVGFGFLSAASVAVMYRFRHAILYWPARRQGVFAGVVWGVHVLVFVLLLIVLWVFY